MKNILYCLSPLVRMRSSCRLKPLSVLFTDESQEPRKMTETNKEKKKKPKTTTKTIPFAL